MKRLIPAAILLIFVLSTAIAGNIIITDGCEKVNEKLNICNKYISSNDKASALKIANETYDYWEDYKIAIALFANRKLIDDTSDSIAHICKSIKSDDMQNYNYEYLSAKLCIEKIIKAQKIGLESFL